MNRHSLSFYGPTAAAPHQLQGRKSATPRGRLSPPNPRSLLRGAADPSFEEKQDDIVLPVMKVFASNKLPTRSISLGEVPLNLGGDAVDDDASSVCKQQQRNGTHQRNNPNPQLTLSDDDDEEPCSKKDPASLRNASLRTASTKDTTTLFGSIRSSTSSFTNRFSSLRNSNSSTTPPRLASGSVRSSSNSPPPTKPQQQPERRSSSSSAPVTKNEIRRRRSSRKSVNGLVIEFDLDDESDCILYADCDDYEEDLRPDLTRQDSNESLEELRTRLEALEHERQQLPDHDKIGLGEECMNKKFMEALESSHHSQQQDANSSTSSTPKLMAHLRNSFASQSGMSLLDIPEYADEEEDEEDSVEEAGEPLSLKVQRRSTIRSSIHGLVLEYDWLTSSEDELDEEDDDEAEDDKQ
ncbi:expressed unknown protein [Seminavis robusta]|uniref:Uncharacterized protein n=1 Tax=Seminavis robusta TaxID=568900 RepID=A0A9N8DWA8_9STRA|nr:expressed unknown protein [Seminavis robusta]|eukprot:Sro424_g139960.1 n/a (410) ;mRNA; f:36549-37778